MIRTNSKGFHLLLSFVFLIGAYCFATPNFVYAKPQLDAPTLSVGAISQTTVDINVTAGSTGAPAGFSLQWMVLSDYEKYGWNDYYMCKASFSGNARDSRYALAPNQTVTVRVGGFVMDNGTSTSCPDILDCDTTYIFRAFAHGNNQWNRSDFSSDLVVTTAPCYVDKGCTFTQGYWKTHGPAAKGNNQNEWQADSLMLGNKSYDQLQLQAIFDTVPSGNGLISLAHQLIAAKLNIANGASAPPEVVNAIAAADALIGDLEVPPIGNGYLAPSVTSALTSTLDAYNNGIIGPGHCQ